MNKSAKIQVSTVVDSIGNALLDFDSSIGLQITWAKMTASYVPIRKDLILFLGPNHGLSYAFFHVILRFYKVFEQHILSVWLFLFHPADSRGIK